MKEGTIELAQRFESMKREQSIRRGEYQREPEERVLRSARARLRGQRNRRVV